MSDALPIEIETAIAAFMDNGDINREEAVERILRDWLTNHGYLTPAARPTNTKPRTKPARMDKPDPQYVQYPDYYKGGGSL